MRETPLKPIAVFYEVGNDVHCFVKLLRILNRFLREIVFFPRNVNRPAHFGTVECLGVSKFLIKQYRVSQVHRNLNTFTSVLKQVPDCRNVVRLRNHHGEWMDVESYHLLWDTRNQLFRVIVALIYFVL